MTVGSQVKQTLSSLKGIEASLRIYSIQTRDEEARVVYEEAFKAIGKTVKDLEARLNALEFQEPQYKGN